MFLLGGVGWVERELVVCKGGHETVDNGVMAPLVLPTLTRLVGKTGGVEFLGKEDGVIRTTRKEKDTGVVGRIEGWVLPTGE